MTLFRCGSWYQDGSPYTELVTRVSGSPGSDRRRLLADGAIELLATDGVHGLTHRRLDKALGIPAGSTSNVFRRRIDLLKAALDELVEREMVVVQDVMADRESGPWTVDTAADLFADVIDAWLLPANHTLLVARYTLILESSRSDELAPLLIAARGRFTELAELLCAAAGVGSEETSTDPAVQLVAWADGVLLAHVTAGVRAPTRADVHQGVRRLLEL
ncbi:hypothetical protein CH272_20395 [Rhodococcus sp. 05-340-1]|nr:hypothetical protein CH271_05355 [Rhodococcus sp. 05-340-2]OZD74035.1 hypothetical protein CH272_20395 [Rhodococcus sp. 05-340-1]